MCAIRKIVTDITFLKRKSEPVLPTDNSEEIANLIADMKETLEAEPNALGLSAIQVGVPKRIIVVKAKLDGIENGKDYEYMCLINPEIVEQYDTMIYPNEGCLSFPNQWVTTRRYKYCKVVDAVRPTGWIFMNKLAHVFLHEYDHLNGLTMFDREYKTGTVGRNEPCPECLEKGIKIKFKKCKEHYK